MKLASYNHNGRASWGVVIGDARIVDVRPRLPRYHTLLDILRADALDEVRETIIDVRPDFKVGEVELLPPVVAPEKCVRLKSEPPKRRRSRLPSAVRLNGTPIRSSRSMMRGAQLAISSTGC